MSESPKHAGLTIVRAAAGGAGAQAAHDASARARAPYGPLGAAAMDDLIARWRQVGVWLSFWDRRGRMIRRDRSGARFWNALMVRTRELPVEAARRVQTALQGPAAGAAPPGHAPDWCGDLGLAAFPIVKRQRPAGAVLAGWLRRPPGEDFQRLCDRNQVDMQVLARLAAGLPAHDDATADGWCGLLCEGLRQSVDAEGAAQEIEGFARDLGETYEVLNMIYSVSSLLTPEDDPATTLARLGDEVRTVGRVAATVLVLPGARPADSVGAAGAAPARSPSEGPGGLRCIVSGTLPADSEAVLRLARQLGVVPPPDTAGEVGAANVEMPQQAIRNDARQIGDLAWASGWLEHVVAVPLACEGRWLGALLALNRTTSGDFSSVEIKFLKAVADRVTSYLQSQRLYSDLAELLMGMLHALISSIDAKDPYTCGHSERVAAMSRRLAEQIGLDPAACRRVYLAGLLHDVGKIGVPDAILCKPGKLTREEFQLLRRHPEIGAHILSRIPQVQDLLPGVLHHHERMDGRGYPHQLAGENIPLLGRMICLTDCFDAMTTNRTYRAALPVETALAEIRRCAGTQFDPHLAERFLEIDLRELLARVREETADLSRLHRVDAVYPSVAGGRILTRGLPQELLGAAAHAVASPHALLPAAAQSHF